MRHIARRARCSSSWAYCFSSGVIDLAIGILLFKRSIRNQGEQCSYGIGTVTGAMRLKPTGTRMIDRKRQMARLLRRYVYCTASVEIQDFVKRALAVAFQVQRDVAEA